MNRKCLRYSLYESYLLLILLLRLDLSLEDMESVLTGAVLKTGVKMSDGPVITKIAEIALTEK